MNLVLNLKNSTSAPVSPVATTSDVPTVDLQQQPVFEKKEEEPEVEKVTATEETDDVLDYFKQLAES